MNAPPDSPSPDAALAVQPRRRVGLAAPHEPAAADPNTTPPSFTLLDDAGGRFVIDPDEGVISLKDEALLERERGAVHSARLRVSEPSGGVYELELQLRLTGRVPQLVGSDDLAALAGTGDTAPAPKPLPAAAWAQFAAAHGVRRKCPLCGEAAPFGALLAAPLPQTGAASAALGLAQAPPRPAPRDAAWTV